MDISGTSSPLARQQPTALGGQDLAQQASQPPTPRARALDGTFVSLAQPPSPSSSRSLESVLTERLAFREDITAHALSTLQLRATVELILALDKDDQTPNADATTCEAAVKLLLELGQARLLCRLAELNRSFHYVFDVGVDPRRAEVLARIGATWPQDVSVSIKLDANIPADALLALHDFVQSPSQLKLHVVADAIMDSSATDTIGKMVGHRPLEALSLEINGLALPVLQGLSSVKARSITIVATCPMRPDFGVLPPTDADADDEGQFKIRPFELKPLLSPEQTAAYQDVAVDLVRKSGTQVLRLPQSQSDEELCVRLLASRTAWDTVEFSMADSGAILKWLSDGQQTIGRLEVNAWAEGHDIAMVDLLAWAAKNGVHTIVFHDAVSLSDMGDGLERYLLRSSRVFERIEACFVVELDPRDGEETFEQEMLQSLLGNPAVKTLRHTPLAELPGTTRVRSDTVPIGDDTIARLNTMSALNSLVDPGDRFVRVQRAAEKRWTQTADHLGHLLSCQGATTLLIGTLMRLGTPLTQPKEDLWPKEDVWLVPAFDDDLRGAFAAMDWFGVDLRLIKAAVSACLRDHREMVFAMCRAVMESKLPMREIAPQEWERRGKPYAKTWLSEDEMARYEEAVARGDNMSLHAGMRPEILGLTAPPVHGDPNALDPAAKALASAVPGADGGVASAGLVVSTPVDPLALLTPGFADFRIGLQRRFQERADAHQGSPAVARALGIVLRLLDDGVFHPTDVGNDAVASALVTLLLDAGQGRMLKHLIENTVPPRNWRLNIDNANAASALLDVSPWPQELRCGCTIRMDVALSRRAVEDVAAFANTVKAEQLVLVVMVDNLNASQALEDIITSRPGLHLALRAAELPVDVEATVAFLKKLETVKLQALILNGLKSDDTRLENALIDLIKRSGVKQLDIGLCSPGLMRTVLRHQRWEALKVWSVLAATAAFEADPPSGSDPAPRAQPVSARKLHIRMQDSAGEDPHACVESMVALCRNLDSLEIGVKPVHALSLARGLDRNRSVRRVKAEVKLVNAQQKEEVLNILRRNTSVTQVDLGNSKVNWPFLLEVLQLATRNLLRLPGLTAVGAGKGFGLSVGGFDMRDVGGRIGSMLAPEDIVRLSLVSKATYFASRRPWETEVDRLASLFAVTSAEKFKSDLVRQLIHLHGKALTLSGPALTAATPAKTLLDKVVLMQSVGVPQFAVAEALRRMLKADPASSRACLEAMVLVGAYPAEVWLRDIAGIDLQADVLPA